MYDSLFDIGYDGVSNEFGLGFWGGFLKPLIRVGMRNPGDVSAAGKFMLFMLTTFTSIVFLALLYFVARHVLYTLGKKSGQENGWMAFVPVARAIYLCKLADMPIGFIVLQSKTIMILIFLLLWFTLLNASALITAIIVVLYVIAFIVIRIMTHMKLQARFGFNIFGAFLPYPLELVIEALIAYSNFEDKKNRDVMTSVDGNELKKQVLSEVKEIIRNNSVNSGSSSGRAVQGGTVSLSPDKYAGRIIGVSGKYVGVVFDIKNGEQFKFGRSADKSNIVFDSTDADISREHCIIRYANGAYQVTDVSTNGTYLEDGTAIGRGNTVNLSPGRVILLGKQKKNSFRLG